MSKKSYQVDVVDFAYQIIEMHRALLGQERELEQLRHYKDEYMSLLDKSIKHSDVTMRNLLDVLIDPDKYKET